MNVGEHGGLRRDHGCGVTAGVESFVALRSCAMSSGLKLTEKLIQVLKLPALSKNPKLSSYSVIQDRHYSARMNSPPLISPLDLHTCTISSTTDSSVEIALPQAVVLSLPR